MQVRLRDTNNRDNHREIENVQFKKICKIVLRSWFFDQCFTSIICLTGFFILKFFSYEDLWIILVLLLGVFIVDLVRIALSKKFTLLTKNQKFAHVAKASDTVSKIVCVSLTIYLILKKKRGFIFSVIPRIITFVLVVIKNFLEKKYTEAENYYRGIRLTLSASYLLIHFNVVMKVDDRLKWDWPTVFWPFWILSALYFGAIFMSTIGVVWKLCSIMCKCGQNCYQLKAILWFVVNIQGIAIFSIFFFFNLEKSLDGGKLQYGLVLTLLCGGIISGMVVGYSFMIRKDILRAFWDIREQYLKELDEENQINSRPNAQSSRRNRVAPLSRVRPRQNNQARGNQGGENKDKKNKKKVKKLAIPKYLIKLGGAFFARATAKDIFFQKMEKQKYKIQQKKRMKSLVVKPKMGSVLHSKNSVIRSLERKKSKKQRRAETIGDDVVIMMGSHRSRGDFETNRIGKKKTLFDNKQRRKEEVLSKLEKESRFKFDSDFEVKPLKKPRSQAGAGKLFKKKGERLAVGSIRSIKPDKKDIPGNKKVNPLNLPKGKLEDERSVFSDMKLSNISSEDEKQVKKKVVAEGSELREDELCCLCFAKKADSVIMPCGHGGICNPCSLELFSGCKDCPICRNEIIQVVLLDSKKEAEKLKKVVSVWEIDSNQSSSFYSSGDSGSDDNNDDDQSVLQVAG